MLVASVPLVEGPVAVVASAAEVAWTALVAEVVVVAFAALVVSLVVALAVAWEACQRVVVVGTDLC